MNTDISDTLFLIPARGGSKGIPGKNIKPLAGKPLIRYAIDNALALASPENICVSTDSEEIAAEARRAGLDIAFMRPAELATDKASTHDVIIHALDFFRNQGKDYSRIVLLQPTSPLLTPDDISSALSLFTEETEMVVSVKPAATNPYYNAYETAADGTLHISKGDGHYTRRQDAPEVWEYNGAVYVIDANALRQRPMSEFERRIPYIMPAERSIDLDTPLDWIIAEAVMNAKNNSDDTNA